MTAMILNYYDFINEILNNDSYDGDMLEEAELNISVKCSNKDIERFNRDIIKKANSAENSYTFCTKDAVIFSLATKNELLKNTTFDKKNKPIAINSTKPFLQNKSTKNCDIIMIPTKEKVPNEFILSGMPFNDIKIADGVGAIIYNDKNTNYHGIKAAYFSNNQYFPGVFFHWKNGLYIYTKHIAKPQKIKEEKQNTGVLFEWAIVYWALKKSGMTDQALLERHAALHSYGSPIDDWAQSALLNVNKKLWATARHSDETIGKRKSISAKPEPKTDICFGNNDEYKVSVKMSGEIQIASGQGKSSAITLRKALEEFYKKTDILKDDTIAEIITAVENMPTQMLSGSNKDSFNKAKERKPEQFATMVTKNDEILPQYDWDLWIKNPQNKKRILEVLQGFIIKHDGFLYCLIYEALTGAKSFENNPLAIANYILTPNHFYEINESYVDKIKNKVKIDIRAKSRDGIYSAAMRMDYKTEGIIDFFKGIALKIKTKIKSFFNKIKYTIFDKPGEFNFTIKLD